MATYEYIKDGDLWNFIKKDIHNNNINIYEEERTASRHICNESCKCKELDIYDHAYDDPSYVCDRSCTYGETNIHVIAWLKICSSLNDPIIFFDDCAIEEKIYRKDSSEEFINFITYFQIKKLYNLKQFSYVYYDIQYATYYEGIDKYNSARNGYDELIKENIMLLDDIVTYIMVHDAEDLINLRRYRKKIKNNLKKLLNIEFFSLLVLAKYNMKSKNSVAVSEQLILRCIFNKNINYYMQNHDYNWWEKGKFACSIKYSGFMFLIHEFI